MKFHRLGLINKDQRGITLLELLIAVGITGIVTGAITMSLLHVYAGSARSSNHMLAVKQVENAGYWISHDTQMAQSFTTDDDAGTAETEVLNLNWTGWEYNCGGTDTCISSYEVRYTFDTASNELWRQQKVTTKKYDSNGQLIETTVSPATGWDTTVVADYMTPIPAVTIAGNKISVTLTASIGDSEEVRTYEITPRPNA
jgi:type II secretory pathway pseudopilin PulG